MNYTHKTTYFVVLQLILLIASIITPAGMIDASTPETITFENLKKLLAAANLTVDQKEILNQGISEKITQYIDEKIDEIKKSQENLDMLKEKELGLIQLLSFKEEVLIQQLINSLDNNNNYALLKGRLKAENIDKIIELSEHRRPLDNLFKVVLAEKIKVGGDTLTKLKSFASSFKPSETDELRKFMSTVNAYNAQYTLWSDTNSEDTAFLRILATHNITEQSSKKTGPTNNPIQKPVASSTSVISKFLIGGTIVTIPAFIVVAYFNWDDIRAKYNQTKNRIHNHSSSEEQNFDPSMQVIKTSFPMLHIFAITLNHNLTFFVLFFVYHVTCTPCINFCECYTFSKD